MNNSVYSGTESYLMTLEGEAGFDLSNILDKVKESVGKIGDISSQVSSIFNQNKNYTPPAQIKPAFDYKPYILPAGALAMVLLIKALKK